MKSEQNHTSFIASAFPPGHKQSNFQPKNPNIFVNFWFLDWNFYCKTKSETLRTF